SPPHLGARPAPAAGARPGVAAPPPPAPRRKSPESAGAATADPDPASASSPVPALGFDSPSRCPLRGGRAGQGALQAPGRPWDLCSRCRTPSASREQTTTLPSPCEWDWEHSCTSSPKHSTAGRQRHSKIITPPKHRWAAAECPEAILPPS
ncbi:translation initiation factor IF-2-like, partial [Molothrus ater]|uniref:translation initiation factor IF-2-like n=1 Tax=Molothrus ater TaxID=84834 RepID=UPI0023E8651A